MSAKIKQNRFATQLISVALEKDPTTDVLSILENAYEEDRVTTIQTIMYIRDQHHGMGHRKYGRMLLKWLRIKDQETYDRLLKTIVIYGRWDDLFYDKDIITPRTIELIKAHIDDTLLKKWLPREKSNPQLVRYLSKELGCTTLKEYRMLLKSPERFNNTLYRGLHSYSLFI